MSSFVTPGTGALVAVENHKEVQSISSGKSPVYAIDFSAVACGARIASTKRKIRWRFGFTNLDALEAGLTGQECRGEEHDVSFVWSISSGKRVVHVDNHEIHYSNSRSSTFEFSWTMRGNHVLKIVAHASAPITATQGYRQYNFYVDGLSFFNFPRVYRLNISGGNSQGHSSSYTSAAVSGTRRVSGENQPVWKLEEPQNEQEEEAILKEIIETSLKESTKASQNEKKEVETEQSQPVDTSTDLLDFFSDPPATSADSVITQEVVPAQNYSTYNLETTASAKSPWETSMIAAPPDKPNPHSFAQPSSVPEFAQTPHNTPASFSQTSVANVSPVTYTPPVTYPTPTQAPADTAGFATPSILPNTPYITPSTTSAPVSQNTVETDFQQNQTIASTKDNVNNLDLKVGNTLADQAYMKIANDFSLLSTGYNAQNVRSNPFDDPQSFSAPQPTLEGLKTSKPETTKKEVMKPSTTPVSGAMVASGTPSQGNWTGYGTQYTQYPTQYSTSGTAQPGVYGTYPTMNNQTGYASQQPMYSQYNTSLQTQPYAAQHSQYQQQTQYYQQQPNPGNGTPQYK